MTVKMVRSGQIPDASQGVCNIHLGLNVGYERRKGVKDYSGFLASAPGRTSLTQN